MALAVTLLLAAGISLAGMGLGLLLAWILDEPLEIRSPLLFGLSMKHTGLALVLAGTVLKDQPLAIFIIVVATLVQHLVAGGALWLLSRRV